MSLRINKDNLYVMLPSNAYFAESKIDDSLDDDFTLFARVKLNIQSLTAKESFIVSRNGMHSGISAFKNFLGKVYVQYTYWCKNPVQDMTFAKQVQYELHNTEALDFIEVYMANDQKNNKIGCFFNGNLVGSIVYDGLDRIKYENIPYWFGCGGMFGDESDRCVGDFEFDKVFAIKKKLYSVDIIDILKNYDTLYSSRVYETYKGFNKEWELTKYFAFFCDFNTVNRYKIWNYVFNGNFPQLYIDGNIYY